MRTAITLLGATLLLAACDTTTTAGGPQAGGEDFPNAVNALGSTLALGMDSTKNWNGLDSASTDVGTGGSTLEGAASGGAARALALCTEDSAWSILGSSASFSKTTCIPGSLGTVHDSLSFAYFPGMGGGDIDTVYWWSTDSLRPVTGYESYTWIQPYKRSYVLVKGDTGKVQLNVRRTLGTWTDMTEMVADGGRDGVIGTGEDNTYWSAKRSLVRNAATTPDTSWALWIQPWKAGQPVIGTTDSGWARVTKQIKLAAGRKVESGVLVAHRDTTRNYARLWSARTDWTFGLVREQAVFGPAADSTFQARDTVRLLDRFRRTAGLDSTRTEVKAILGPSLARHDQDSVLSINFERYRSSLVERHTIWQLQSDNPVANGSESKSGTLFARVEFADTTFSHAPYAQFHGRWDSHAFTGVWSNGKDSAMVVVSRNGTVQSLTKL